MKKKVEKKFNSGTWTESRYFSQIRSALRNAFRYWKPMMEVLEDASRPSQSENKRLKKEYQCFSCKKWHPRKNVEIDHIVECGSLKTYEDIVPFIQRLACEDKECYNILCKPCHKTKTQEYKNTKLLEP